MSIDSNYRKPYTPPTPEDLKAADLKRFEALDMDEDKRLGLDEFLPQAEGRYQPDFEEIAEARDRFARYDGGPRGDGLLTQEEFLDGRKADREAEKARGWEGPSWWRLLKELF